MPKFLKWVANNIKREIDLTREYYTGQPNQASAPISSSSEHKNPISRKAATDKSLWPFSNDVNIWDLTQAERCEREQKIQMYMEAYPFLPFQICDSRLIRPNTSGCIVNMNNKQIIITALQELDHLVVDLYSNENVIRKLLPDGLRIPYNKLCFDYPTQVTTDSMPQTYIEYRPLTNAGKRSYNPLIVHFSTVRQAMDIMDNECGGELTYGVDGNIISAVVRIFKDNRCYTYNFGVVGRTFTITKISTPNYETRKQVVIYESSWDFIEY